MAQELSTKNVDIEKLNKPYKEEKKIPWWKRKMPAANLPGPKWRPYEGATRFESGSKLPRLKRK